MKKRDLYFKAALKTTEKLAKEKISGSMFWHFYDEGVGPGRFGVRTSDVSTWKLIENHAKFMAALSGLQTSCPSCDGEQRVRLRILYNNINYYYYYQLLGMVPWWYF